MSIAEFDLVNRPSHYCGRGGLEVIDIIEAWGLGFHLGNAVKYILRAGNKGDREQDLRKAKWYLDRQGYDELGCRTAADRRRDKPTLRDICQAFPLSDDLREVVGCILWMALGQRDDLFPARNAIDRELEKYE